MKLPKSRILLCIHIEKYGYHVMPWISHYIAMGMLDLPCSILVLGKHVNTLC